MPKERTVYTKEECAAIFATCKNRTEFKAHHESAFRTCKENGWDKEICPSFFDWEKPKTFEEAVQMTLKYYSRSDLWRDSHRLHYFLEKMGWLDKIEHLKPKTDETTLNHCVYVYEFKEYNTAYIGRTNDLKRRHNQHLRSQKDCIYRFIEEKGIKNVELPRVIYEKIGPSESQEKEKEQLEKYISDGWNVLNKAKTGSLGMLKYKYSRKICYELAKKFDTKKAFREANRGAYFTAMAKGWLNDYAWLKHAEMPKRIYTYEECKKAAVKCESRTEFMHKHWLMYDQSFKNGWLDDFIASKVVSYTIIKYDLNGKFLEEIPKIHQVYGKRADRINQVTKNGKHYAYSFLWYIKETVLDEKGEVLKQITPPEFRLFDCYVLYKTNGEFVKEYNSRAKAVKDGYIGKHIDYISNHKYTNLEELLKYHALWFKKNELVTKYGEVPMKIDPLDFI